MSEAVKMHHIEILIKEGNRRRLFLVSKEKADAIETLLSESPEDDEDFIDADKIFPDLNDSKKLPGIVFRGIRAKTGLTQAEVAAKLGITQVDVSKIENGKRPIGKALAKRIEKKFKIDYRRFL
ncbi:MAG: helix-turn-helix transcriptional regulator [Oligoflexia bacterium]|nr:helix-turn-helix transcriptional regulator [Oligoflexia bacterium]